MRNNYRTHYTKKSQKAAGLSAKKKKTEKEIDKIYKDIFKSFLKEPKT